MDTFVTATTLDQIPAGRGMTVSVQGRPFALFRLDGAIYALEGSCPHRGGPLGEGLLENGSVYCPLHGWEFDLKTGACKERPDRPGISVPVRIVGESVEIQIKPPPAPSHGARSLADNTAPSPDRTPERIK